MPSPQDKPVDPAAQRTRRNDSQAVKAQQLLRKGLLAAANTPGFRGAVKIEVNVKDGLLGTIVVEERSYHD